MKKESEQKMIELVSHLLETYCLPEVLEFTQWAKERDEKLLKCLNSCKMFKGSKNV